MTENQFHNQISRELGGINENLKTIKDDIKGLKDQVTIANGRTRKLEDWKLKVNTRTGLIAAIVSTLIGLAAWLLNYFK